jgi:hypothetical protein
VGAGQWQFLGPDALRFAHPGVGIQPGQAWVGVALAAFVLLLRSGIPVFAAGRLACWRGKMPGFMAKVLGESGRYVSQEATRCSHAIWTLAVITMAVVGAIFGLTIQSYLPALRLAPAGSLPLSLALLLLMLLVARVAFRRMDGLEKERECMRKGAAGEKSVAHTLSKFPDEFRVVNDVATPTGNLDHVVIGPTGVFVIETKDWRGIVGADRKGELTLNGKPLPKPHVKRFVGRVMGTKERVRALAPGVDPFFKAVMVFTSAWVDAKFRTTGWADCISDNQLMKHIVDCKSCKRLSAEEVAVIAQAFSSLARMDPDFCAKAEPGPGLAAPKSPASVPITSGLCTGVRATEPVWNKA